MLSKSLIQFSVDGLGCVPFLLFDLRPNYGGGNEDTVDLLQNVQCTHCCTQCSNSAAGHHRPRPLPETPGHSQASLGQPLVVSLLLSPGSWYPQGFVYALQASVFSVLCKFLGLYGGVNGNLLQQGLYHPQVGCIQSPGPYGRPLLTHTSTGDTNTQRQV